MFVVQKSCMSYKILKINKPIGLTPIQLWLSFRSRNFLPDMRAIESQRLPKGAICGKLDPMAEGELIILLDRDWPLIFPELITLESIPMSISGSFKEVMDSLCNHEKIYEFGLLIGVSTDSDDRLGIVENIKAPIHTEILKVKEFLLAYANSLKEQEYHVYSAKRAQNKEGMGQSLWWWKKQGRLSEIEIPKHACFIKEIELLEGTDRRPSQITSENFMDQTIDILGGNRENLTDFEIDKVIVNWSESRSRLKEINEMPIINVRVRVTSGTFIRQICRDLIKKTGIPMLCFYIDRKSVIIS